MILNTQDVNYEMLDDADLWLLLKRGDERAYTAIYTRYHSLLYLYVYKKLQDKQEAQDVVQEVLIHIWKNRVSLPSTISLPAYLYTAVRNKAFDIFAHRKVKDKYIASLQAFIPTYSGTDYLLRENEIRSIIQREIDALPPRMKQIFELSRKNRLTNKEIAALLSLSSHTVDTQIKRALKILKKKLGPYFFIILILFEN